MNNIMEVLENKRNEISNRLLNIEYNEAQRVVLKDIISCLDGDDYNFVKNKIEFIEDKLQFVFDKNMSLEYTNLIEETVIILLKCQQNKKVDELYFETYKDFLVRIRNCLERYYQEFKENYNKSTLLNKKNKIEKLLIVITNKVECSNKYLKDTYDLLIEMGIDKKDVVLLLESLGKMTNEKTEMTTVTEILNSNLPIMAIEDFKHDEFSKIKALFKSCQAKYRLLDKKDFYEETNEIIVNNASNIASTIIKYLLNDIRTEIENLKDCLLDKDFYFDEESLKEIIGNYQEQISNYNHLNDILNSLKTQKDIHQELRNIAFLMTNRESYFERDIKGFAEEYLQPTFDLLDSILHNDPLVVSKSIVSFTNISEFKYDKFNNKIRIMVSTLDNSQVVILGVFIKSSQWDNKKYVALASRTKLINKKDLTNLKDRYPLIKEYVISNARKGTRR